MNFKFEIMHAIVEIAGKQYLVKQGDVVTTEKIKAGNAGAKLTADKVLLKFEGDKIEIGEPVVSGSSVEYTVKEHFKDEKIRVFKKKPKKRYQRTQGHRQNLTKIEITSVR